MTFLRTLNSIKFEFFKLNLLYNWRRHLNGPAWMWCRSQATGPWSRGQTTTNEPLVRPTQSGSHDSNLLSLFCYNRRAAGQEIGRKWSQMSHYAVRENCTLISLNFIELKSAMTVGWTADGWRWRNISRMQLSDLRFVSFNERTGRSIS